MNCDSSSVTSPSAEDAERVRDRHGQPEQDGVPRRAALADEVGGDDRLAVARAERVRRAPEERDRERDQDHADAQVVLRDQAGEAAVGDRPDADALVEHAARDQRRRRRRRRCPGASCAVRLGDVERALEQVLRVGRGARGRSSSWARSSRSRARPSRTGRRSPSSRSGRRSCGRGRRARRRASSGGRGRAAPRAASCAGPPGPAGRRARARRA